MDDIFNFENIQVKSDIDIQDLQLITNKLPVNS